MRLSAFLVLALSRPRRLRRRRRAPAPPPTYVVRHLNTPAGERDPDLTAGGAARRRRRSPAGSRASAPRAIYVSDFRRTRQTAAPLAARLGLTPIVYDPADTPGLIARVRAEPRPGADRRPQQHRARHRRAARRHPPGTPGARGFRRHLAGRPGRGDANGCGSSNERDPDRTAPAPAGHDRGSGRDPRHPRQCPGDALLVDSAARQRRGEPRMAAVDDRRTARGERRLCGGI